MWGGEGKEKEWRQLIWVQAGTGHSRGHLGLWVSLILPVASRFLWVLVRMKLPWICTLLHWVLLKGTTAYGNLSSWQELLCPNSGNCLWPVIITPVPTQTLWVEWMMVLFVVPWLLFLCRHWLTWRNLIKSIFPWGRFLLTWSAVELDSGTQTCECLAGLCPWWWTNITTDFWKCFSGVWRIKIAVKLPTKI